MEKTTTLLSNHSTNLYAYSFHFSMKYFSAPAYYRPSLKIEDTARDRLPSEKSIPREPSAQVRALKLSAYNAITSFKRVCRCARGRLLHYSFIEWGKWGVDYMPRFAVCGKQFFFSLRSVGGKKCEGSLKWRCKVCRRRNAIWMSRRATGDLFRVKLLLWKMDGTL